MFKSKSILAIVLTLILTIGSMSGVFAYTPPTDVIGTQYEEAAKVMGALNIMIGDDSGQFKPNDQIRRSEFAKLVVALSGLSDVAATPQPTRFADVQADHWASGYINMAVARGYMIGDDQGNFRPDDNILYQDAITALVRVLGYTPSANAMGGYPGGFMSVAAQEGLIQSNTVSTGNTPAIRGLVANLAYNSLTINLMEQTGFGENPTYSKTDKTILVDFLKTQEVKGTVTANAATRLNGAGSSLKDDEVEIASNIYKTNGTDAASYLGKNVAAYAKNNKATSTKDIILIQEDPYKTSSVRINGDNLADLTNGATEKQLEYWLNKDTDTKTQKARILNEAVMVYNGKVIPFDNALVVPAAGLQGTVELIDNTQDSVYDVVKVSSFENYVVQDVAALSNRINDKYGKASIVLDKNDTTLKFTITKDGKAMQLTDLKEWDVLSVAQSQDGKLIDIRVSGASVTGKVTAKSHDGKLTIDGTQYKVANNYPYEVSLGDEGTFYLDVNGKIAAVDATATMSDNYAYLVNAAKASSGIDESVEFKFFKKDGTTVVLKGAEKMRLNSQSGMTGQQVLDALKDGGAVKAQLVTFEVNANNQVSKIMTATDKTGEANMVFGVKAFTQNFAGNDVTYKSASGKLGRIVVNSNTVVFDIPAGVTDSTEYAVRDKSMFENEGSYNIAAYDVGEDLNAKVLIVTNATGATSEESAIAVVSSIETVVNADNVTVEKLIALQNGEKVEKNTNAAGVLVKDGGSLEAGDIIQYRLNAKGEIDKITVLFDRSTLGTQEENQVSDNMTLVVGRVTAKFTGSINVAVNDGEINNYDISDATVYSFDSKKASNQVTISSAGDIQKFDNSDPRYVFMRIYKDQVKEVVILH